MRKPSGKNRFGGKNVNSLYLPMSEIEQEVIARLVDSDDLQVVIIGWGIVHKPAVVFGDLRVSFQFRMTFNAPALPMPVYYFDMSLQTRAGEVIFQQRQSCLYGGKPISVVAGMYLDMAWDIAIQHMDPAFVKRVLPGVVGLTSRVLDKDTKQPTVRGNMSLNTLDADIAAFVRRGEQKLKQADAQKVVEVTASARKAGYEE